jgi:hypothetical protein
VVRRSSQYRFAFRQPEVENLHPAVARQEDVLRLQIPMHDAAAVGGGEARDELQRDIGGASQRDGSAFDDGAQRLPLEQLGD